MRFPFFLLLVTYVSALQAGCPCCQFSLGEESYVLWREREGGTHQAGRIDGVFSRFERIKGGSWYAGADYLYATGEMHGETGRGSPQNSCLTDEIFEVRLGYTLQQCRPNESFITPFGGWGSFKEVNHFNPPSPLPVKFTDTFNYVVVGFLSGVNLTPLLSMGVNFKVKFMLNGESKVTEDPLFEDVTLTMEKEIQCRVEVPFTYNPRCSWLGMGGQFTPFYEFRHFGGREGYPFNFRDTKFHLAGMRLSLIYTF